MAVTLAEPYEEKVPRPQRVDIDLPVQLRSRAWEVRATARNVCAGGLFVATPRLLPLGDWVVVSFTMPGATEAVEILGEVRWSRPYQDLVDVPGGLGLRFVETGVRAMVVALELQRIGEASS
ncbi:MAG TPA: PilZ domain-containing protein [Polyangia bacterium]|nr:PilZ domain-containing protein [Polyangia bacterium]